MYTTQWSLIFSQQFIETFAKNENEAYAKAGAIAEEVIGAVRTVYAFGGQKVESERFVPVDFMYTECIMVEKFFLWLICYKNGL